MKVYITPDKVESFQKKIWNMTKHLAVRPKIEFFEPKLMKQITHTIVNNGWGYYGDGSGGYKRTAKMLNVVEVTIDDIGEGDWVLVADVFYREGIVRMVSGKYFKDIPSHLGLGYTKCDYCGKTHGDRIEGHIIYNVKTGEWKQIGTACANKMFEVDKYMGCFTVQLCRCVEEKWGGCCDEMLFGEWVKSQPDHYFQDTIAIDWLIPAVVGYRKDCSELWQKSEYDRSCRNKLPGTTDFLNTYFNENEDKLSIDEGYNAKVKEFVKGLPESEFNNGIKETFEFGYCSRFEVFKVFFAVKMYEDSLTMGDWELIKGKTVVGEHIVVKNGKAESWTTQYGFLLKSPDVKNPSFTPDELTKAFTVQAAFVKACADGCCK